MQKCWAGRVDFTGGTTLANRRKDERFGIFSSSFFRIGRCESARAEQRENEGEEERKKKKMANDKRHVTQRK